MAHLTGKNKKIISRVRRIQGQLEAVIRGLDSGKDCATVLQTVAACRGAFYGLVLELLNDHIEMHISDAEDLASARRESKKLNDILRSYLK